MDTRHVYCPPRVSISIAQASTRWVFPLLGPLTLGVFPPLTHAEKPPSLPPCLSLPLIFFSSRSGHTRSYGDWSSDVCSSDLPGTILRGRPYTVERLAAIVVQIAESRSTVYGRSRKIVPGVGTHIGKSAVVEVGEHHI